MTNLMIRIGVWLMFPLVLSAQGLDSLKQMFKYDLRKDSFRIIVSQNLRESTIHEIEYESPKGGPVKGFLITPSRGKSIPLVVFMHWGLGDKSAFVPEAIVLAKMGAVSLLIDAPFARPKPWRKEMGQDDVALAIQSVADIQKAIDIVAQDQNLSIDTNRIGFVGLSYGAGLGGILSAVDRRIKTFVLMGGLPSLSEFLRSSSNMAEMRKNYQPKEFEQYLQGIRCVDSELYIVHAKNPSFLFQYGRFDMLVPQTYVQQYYAIVKGEKALHGYNCGHEFNDLESLKDRMRWLNTKLNLNVVNISLDKLAD